VTINEAYILHIHNIVPYDDVLNKTIKFYLNCMYSRDETVPIRMKTKFVRENLV